MFYNARFMGRQVNVSLNPIYFDPYAGTHDRYGMDEIVAACSRAGYDGFNLPDKAVFQNRFGKIRTKAIQSLTAKHRLPVSSVLALGPSLTDPGIDRERVMEYHRYILDICLRLNVRDIGVWPSYREVSKGEAFSVLARNLRRLVPLFAQHGKRVLVEFQPHRTPVETVSEALELVRQVSPLLKITCDTTHLSNAERDVHDGVLRLRDCLGDVHISGRNRQAPDADPCDFPAIFQALREIGYQGAFLLQYRLEEDIGEIQRTRRYAASLVRQYLGGGCC